ncbi:meprin A subunit beta-like [Aulostomus maculatus]
MPALKVSSVHLKNAVIQGGRSQGLRMKTKSFIFLAVNWAVFTLTSSTPPSQTIVDFGRETSIPEANGLKDDILPSPQRSAVSQQYAVWDPPVPYVLGSSLDMNAKGVTLQALDQFRLRSCIDFKPLESEVLYISVQKDAGCYSYIGQTVPYGQIVSIGEGCDFIATVEHEFLHALGFYHEQSRNDRDDYVTIRFENIMDGVEYNFRKAEDSDTQGVPYDYLSVMHYGPYAFSNGNGTTITTKNPAFQDKIGQRLGVSPSDMLELNLLYKCESSIAFKMYCGFIHGNMCGMDFCSQSSNSWKMMSSVPGGPLYDHTNLPSGGSNSGQGQGYFMHASTVKGEEGDSAWLETHRMRLNRDCHIQCLQFYYFHTGNSSDALNIWIREFSHEYDTFGTLYHMAQITGPPSYYWKLQHVTLNAKHDFQVEFEVRKGAGVSGGGFSIDDINLSETECPHVTLQLNYVEELLNKSEDGTVIFGPTQYSQGGYNYRVGVSAHKTFFGTFVQLMSGKYDDELEWPCPDRQVTFQVLDQNPQIQLQMSKQYSLTTDPYATDYYGNYIWENPRKNGSAFIDENNQVAYAGPWAGIKYFVSLEQLRTRDFLKGGSVIFNFNFQDITPLVNGSELPCPEGPVRMAQPMHRSPCTQPFPTHLPPPRTTDDSIFGFSPGVVSSPVLVLLTALMLFIR